MFGVLVMLIITMYKITQIVKTAFLTKRRCDCTRPPNTNGNILYNELLNPMALD